MHFTDAVDAGRILAQGMGTTVGNAMVSMIPGLVEEGKNIRDFITSTPACTGTCDGMWELPPWADGATNAEAPARIFHISVDEASAPPYSNLSKHTIMLIELFTVSAQIKEYETIYQFRNTQLVD